MLEQVKFKTLPAYDQDIARYEVSEDGVTWRPYDPRRDRDRPLHKRIEFAPSSED